MAFKLSAAEIRRFLQEGRNYKRLHAKQQERNQVLSVRVKKLEEENRLLRQQVAERDALIEKLELRLDDLEKMIFGKKKNRDGSSSSQDSSDPGSNQSPDKKRRPPSSYQRPIPPDSDVTKTKHHAINACHHCGGPLSQLEDVIRYVEDIILPQLLQQLTKTVTKHVIERGYCGKCGVWSAARDVRGQVVSLGRNVKLLVVYLVSILDCSYEQVKTLTGDLYGLTLSDGEIVNILHDTAIVWQPEYEDLKEEIRAGPGAHLDETTWPIQTFAKHCYAWVMSAVASPIRIYTLATSRGKHHAQALLGEVSETFVRITDCYAAYKNLPGLHQICWAHLYRKIRDLLTNDNLPTTKLPHVQAWHDDFKALYADLRAAVAEPLKRRQRQRQEQDFRERIEQLRTPHSLDPKPLADLKVLLTDYDGALFTCLTFEGIPCDNNRAERDIRLVVKKRRKSFGSKTEAGAHALEILLSVAWSTWYEHRGNFFPALAQLTKTN